MGGLGKGDIVMYKSTVVACFSGNFNSISVSWCNILPLLQDTLNIWLLSIELGKLSMNQLVPFGVKSVLNKTFYLPRSCS
jgi:hypothetical protein